jgi:hypothetical protein
VLLNDGSILSLQFSAIDFDRISVQFPLPSISGIVLTIDQFALQDSR